MNKYYRVKYKMCCTVEYNDLCTMRRKESFFPYNITSDKR